MEFRIQDVLKHILPGGAILLTIFLLFSKTGSFDASNFYITYIKDTGELWVFIFLIVAYFCGYLNDAISSQLEYWGYKLINRPSFSLLNDRNKRYKLVQKNDIFAALSATARPISTKEECHKLFLLANAKKDMNPSEAIKEKVKEYYNSYVFSRNMLTASVVITSVLFYLFGFSFFTLSTSLAILVLFRRWRQKAYCYSRQVFYACLFS